MSQLFSVRMGRASFQTSGVMGELLSAETLSALGWKLWALTPFSRTKIYLHCEILGFGFSLLALEVSEQW